MAACVTTISILWGCISLSKSEVAVNFPAAAEDPGTAQCEANSSFPDILQGWRGEREGAIGGGGTARLLVAQWEGVEGKCSLYSDFTWYVRLICHKLMSHYIYRAQRIWLCTAHKNSFY